jgi:hypothetical protein
MAAKYRPTTETDVSVLVPPEFTLEQMILVMAQLCKNVIIDGAESDIVLDSMRHILEGYDSRSMLSTYFLVCILYVHLGKR